MAGGCIDEIHEDIVVVQREQETQIVVITALHASA